MQIRNVGVAPIYFDAYPTVNGRRGVVPLKGLLPGQTREFWITSGSPASSLSIECYRLVPGQRIECEASLR